MKTSRNMYDNVEKKLSKLLTVGMSAWVISLIPTILLLYVPIFHRNMYIVYNLIVLLAHSQSIRILFATSSDGPSSPNVKRNISKDDTKMSSAPSTQQPVGLTSLDHSNDGTSGNVPLFNPFSSRPSVARTTTSSVELDTRVEKENITELDTRVEKENILLDPVTEKVELESIAETDNPLVIAEQTTN